ncbi:hypothetical protein [Acinetobacter soli]|uniref:VRR-NUC domain-containing protein n=2 Tax=Acinetobacter soli TaxID=487316 RepID=A0AB38YUE9_9GAMM|nr:hypothetical protein [Acinetobacter soli]KQC98326.1 hypothetical protein APD01_09830 [Acinetobacter soli]MDQ8942683.1 hypothetical protein [Acinetobacter soli]WND04935.1 hypothetical protein RHP80_12090 [Acinetobacter soli]
MLPVIIGIIELAGYAATAYELYRTATNAYGEVKNYQDNIKKAKDEIKKIMQNLDKEITDKIDRQREKVLLTTLTSGDKQTNMTKSASGRPQVKSNLITAAIKQKIPFRPIISQICEKADHLPMIQLRKQKGKKLKDVIPKSKVDIVAKLLKMTAEELAGANVDEYIIVRLKQLAVNFMFEFMDELLKWRSPLKAEICFGYDIKTNKYLAPQLASQTRIKRVGSELNPFWPMPYKGRGIIGADIIIPEYRGEPLTLSNIFALVEVKFQNDRIDEKQFKSYEILKSQSAKEKKISNVTASEGFKLSLFRYPEDAIQSEENNPVSSKTKGKGSKK